MKTNEPYPAGYEPEHNYLREPKGLKSWLTTVDHKRIGLMYLFSVATFFSIAGILALLMRIELIAPGETKGFNTPNNKGDRQVLVVDEKGVTRLDKRVLFTEQQPTELLTSDKKNVVVSTYQIGRAHV